ncbi:protein regulator of cytokinesis 1-like isoform X4 [Rhodnius prolixus]|uniref:protein regulator of cytokinesis 1-like isoform X4 n=1 Tax=Rhodnius prolixus TaxID=13249 RepID=UPI003D18B226
MAADISMDETVQKISSLTENTLTELFMKWRKMYKLNDEFQKRSFETFISHVKQLYEHMLESEELRLMKLSEEVEEKLTETIELEKELGVVISRVNTDLPLQQLVVELDNAMKEFKEMKEIKLQHYETLIQKEVELCNFLGKATKSQKNHFPKEKDFEDLELYIFEMSQEKLERIEFQNEAKTRILHQMSLLGLEPLSPFEQKFLSNDEPETLKDDDINKIKELESILTDKFDLVKKNKEFKIDKLKKLWVKLKIPDSVQEEFLESIGDDLNPLVFEKIEKEFSRCETIKLENIKPLILASREKLENLWEKVKWSEEQRKEFCPYYSPFFNEDVLELLEIQVDKLTAYYEENILLFELVEKWSHLWERMIHLEELSKNKNRLFDNRGGQLLKEEKERKAVENNLPKVYAELEKGLLDYKEKNGAPFLWNGQNLLNKLREDWSERELLLKKKKLNKCGMSPGESLQRSASKRKLQYTPNTLTAEHIESRSRTPGRLRENDNPTMVTATPSGPLHSSPTFTPLKTMRTTPRTMITPLKVGTTRTATKMGTPASASRLAVTPKSTSRLATTPASILKTSSSRKGTPKSTATPLSKSRFTPARKFNLII